MLKFIADENINNKIILKLRQVGFDVVSIRESYPGLSDENIIEKIIDEDSILLTEDSDFGKWVFVHKKKIGVIYLRYHYQEAEQISQILINIINRYRKKLLNKFIVVTVKKIRIRDLI